MKAKPLHDRLLVTRIEDKKQMKWGDDGKKIPLAVNVGKKEIPMGHYLVFERSAQDRKVLKNSGYPWDALLFAPVWPFSKGLTLHGVALMVLLLRELPV